MVRAKVLIVEDEAIVAMGIKHKLEKMGHRVIAMVTSGNEAIHAVNEYDIDIILMDIVIKGDIDGIETASIIHSTDDIPIIYLTAYADDEMLERAKITQPYGYIIKPFKSSELNANIEMALFKYNQIKKETNKIQYNIFNDFSEFITQAMPDEDDEELKSKLLNIFGDSLEISYKPWFYEYLNDNGITDDSDGGEVLECYMDWLNELFDDLDVKNNFKVDEYNMDLEFNNCPWKDQAEKNHIYCLNCHAIIKKSFDWADLEGKITRKSTIASGDEICDFYFEF